MAVKKVKPPYAYRHYSQINFSQVIFKSILVLEIPGGSGKSQSIDADFAHVDSPRGFTRVFILNGNIHATRVTTVSAENNPLNMSGVLKTVLKN